MAKNNLLESKLNNRFYYPSLDGLRFFAFLVVFFHHSLQNIHSDHMLINFFLIIIQKNGWVGVDLFFVLSGFLITTLLLKERSTLGKFSLINFWIRRSLRIWPLYYLALLFGFFVGPIFFPNPLINHSRVWEELPWYLVFLGNWKVSLDGYSQYAQISHLWTISLEEQFYLLWPVILIFIKGFKSSFAAGIIILSISIFSRFILASWGVQHPGIYTNTLARIDTLTIGALLALFYFYSPAIFSKIKMFSSFPMIILILSALAVYLYRIYLFDPSQTINIVMGFLIIALFMSYLVFMALQKNTKINKLLAIKMFVWLGKISYGLYIWHILALEITDHLITNPNMRYISILLSFIITVILGYLSYRFYESKFLIIKDRFSLIRTRPV